MIKKRNIVILLLAFFLLAGAIPAQVAPVQQADRANILAATEGIMKEVSQLRGLPAKNAVKSGFKSIKELEEIIIKDLDEENTPQQLASQTKLLVLLGLVPKDFSMREEMIKLLKEQIGGFYEPRTGEFYLVDWLELDEQKPVMAHELMHAIQDQNFNLRRFEKFPKDQSDQELAIQALIEGEATVVMLNYIFKPHGLDITKVPVPLMSVFDMANKTDDNRFPVLSKTPRVVRESLEFPYFYGAAFVQKVVNKDSWQKVSDLYLKDLPESTEQIMHPEKILNRERPVKIKLPDLDGIFGKDWRKDDVDIQGEFGYYLVLSEYLDKELSKEAAAGWGGDQYVFYEQPDGKGAMIAQFSTWDQEKDSVEFFNAYRDRTLKRYEQRKTVKDEASLKIYSAEYGMTLIERRGSKVLVIEGASESNLQRIADEIWKKTEIS